MSAISELYDYIFDKCEEWGYDTYDHLPLESENAKYPFVICGEQQTTTAPIIGGINASAYVTVHVWGSRRQQTEVDEMLNKINTLAYQSAFETKNYTYTGNTGVIDSHVISDDSIPNTVLWHGFTTIGFGLR